MGPRTSTPKSLFRGNHFNHHQQIPTRLFLDESEDCKMIFESSADNNDEYYLTHHLHTIEYDDDDSYEGNQCNSDNQLAEYNQFVQADTKCNLMERYALKTHQMQNLLERVREKLHSMQARVECTNMNIIEDIAF